MAYEKKALEKTILDITERQLFRYGYKSLNLNEVAKEAGISKVTPVSYTHLDVYKRQVIG